MSEQDSDAEEVVLEQIVLQDADTDNSPPQTEEEEKEEEEEVEEEEKATTPTVAVAAAAMADDCPVIITQPGLGVTTTTVTTITQTGGDWSTGMLNVCGDGTTCLMGAFVPCCLDFSLAHQYGECLCLPMLPGSTLAMRVGMRERFKIRGSVCEDWVAVCMCYPLAVCQMIREMKRRTKTQIYQVSTALESS